MRHHQYTALGRELARQHKGIQHSEQHCRFLRILLSSDPIQKQLDLSEFYSSLRDKLDLGQGQAAMILENYQADYDDNRGDAYHKYHNSAFLIVKRVEPGDYDARDQAIDDCEQIGEQLLATLIEQLTDAGLQITPADVMQEAVGPLASYFVGCRFNYVFRSAARQALTHNPANYLS